MALDVVGDVEVEVSIVVRVKERRPGAPAGVGDPRPLGNLLERAVAAIAVKAVGAEVGDVEVNAAVVVVVSGRDAAPPAFVGDPRPRGDVFEGAVAPIAVECALRPFRRTRDGCSSRAQALTRKTSRKPSPS